MKVFISYSSKDKIFAEKLSRDLLKLDLDVWLDKWEIKVGDSLISKISSGLSESDYLIIILSNNSILSEWVNRELNYSLLEEINNSQISRMRLVTCRSAQSRTSGMLEWTCNPQLESSRYCLSESR